MDNGRRYLHLDLEGEHIVLDVPAIPSIHPRPIKMIEPSSSCCPPPYDPTGKPILPLDNPRDGK